MVIDSLDAPVCDAQAHPVRGDVIAIAVDAPHDARLELVVAERDGKLEVSVVDDLNLDGVGGLNRCG